MTDYHLRVYQKIEIDHLKDHLLIYGDLQGQCAKCQALNIELESSKCPQCDTPFQFVAFRNVKQHLPKLKALCANRPQIRVVDYDDFQRAHSSAKAKEFLK